MSDAALPAPLVPSHVDLRNFSYMPVHVLRLRDSGLASESTGEEFKAAILLWCAAWHQIPAGSLPDSDKSLSRFSGLSMADWKEVRETALRGFVKCSDGRLHHPVLAEVVNSSWDEKVKRKQRVESANQAKKEKAFKRGIGADESRYETRDEVRNEECDESRYDQCYEFRDEQRNELRHNGGNEERNDPRNVGNRREGKGRDVKASTASSTPEALPESEIGGVGERASAPAPAAPPAPTRRRPSADLLGQAAPDPKGSRLPADWKLPPDWLAEAQRLGLTPSEAQAEGERFRDYWVAQPGAKGRKSDWPATWRNWVRTTLERRGRKPNGNGSAGHPSLPAGYVETPRTPADGPVYTEEEAFRQVQ